MLSEGSLAPAWTGTDQTGAQRSASDYRGRWVLLYFYPKDDTPGCTTEACAFRDEFPALEKEVAIIGVSADDAGSHKSFAQKYNLPFTLIADPRRDIIAAYGTDNVTFKKRTSFLIDPAGTIRKIYQDIDCAAHAREILADVRQLKGDSA